MWRGNILDISDVMHRMLKKKFAQKYIEWFHSLQQILADFILAKMLQT